MSEITVQSVRERIAQSAEQAWARDLVVSEGIGLWLVGGWVRDFFLGSSSSDLDVVVDTPSSAVVRDYVLRLAERRGGTLVALDERRGYWRLAGIPEGHMDFAARQGEDIAEDLGRRDFTVNAIAWDVMREEFADPFQGIADCASRRLRATSEAVLGADPARTLRAWRFLCTRGLSPDSELAEQVKRYVPRLLQVAAERNSEELSRIFTGDTLAHWEFAERSGLLKVLWPEADMNAGYRRLVRWDRYRREPEGQSTEERAYWREEVRGERPRFAWLGQALLWGLERGEELGRQGVRRNLRSYLKELHQRFTISKRESQMLECWWLHREAALHLLSEEHSRGEWYDFFHGTGAEAISTLLYAFFSSGLESLSGQVRAMAEDFFSGGTVSHPVLPVGATALRERFPELQGARIAELINHLCRFCAEKGGVEAEQIWAEAEIFTKLLE